MSASDAEKIKHGLIPEGVDPTIVHETIDRTNEHVVSELHRQIGFFWNATATDRAIDVIYLCGGGALLHGLAQEIAEKTQTACQVIDCFSHVDWGNKFDESIIQQYGPTMGVSIGLAMRRLCDKKHRLGEASSVSMKRSK
jgi:type IV pilus assembly protein PilM